MEVLTTVVASLIGAVLGSLGAQWLRYRYQLRTEEARTRRDVAQRHLIQLQDATESLYFRTRNLAMNRERNLMTYEYYATSSIYALGAFLAHKRRLMLDGAYALLDVHGSEFPHRLEEALEKVETLIGKEWAPDDSFFRYQRQGLGEALLVWSDGWRVANYAEFLEQAKTGELDQILKAARGFFALTDVIDWDAICSALDEVLGLVAHQTGIGTRDRDAPDRS